MVQGAVPTWKPNYVSSTALTCTALATELEKLHLRNVNYGDEYYYYDHHHY